MTNTRQRKKGLVAGMDLALSGVNFVDVEGLFCPCCEHRLRTKPRNKLYKAKLRGEVL